MSIMRNASTIQPSGHRASKRRPVGPRLEFAGSWQGVSDGPSRAHDFTELMLMRGGRLRLRVEDTVLEGGRHTLFVIPAGTNQHKTTRGLMRSTYVFFEAPSSAFDDSARAVDLKAEPLLRQWMANLLELYHAAERSPVADTLLAVVLDRVTEIERRAGRQRVLHPALAEALRIIQSECAEPLTVAGLSRRARISPSRLSELFRAAFGCGPLMYQQQLRLAQAQRLLRDPYLSVKQVAVLCGYDNANYFSRLFRKRIGCAPCTWREA